MRHNLPETKSKALLFGVIEMALAAKEDDFVLEQEAVDRGDRLLWQIARQLDIPDFGADARSALEDIGTRNDVIDRDWFTHDRVLQLCGFYQAIQL